MENVDDVKAAIKKGIQSPFCLYATSPLAVTTVVLPLQLLVITHRRKQPPTTPFVMVEGYPWSFSLAKSFGNFHRRLRPPNSPCKGLETMTDSQPSMHHPEIYK